MSEVARFPDRVEAYLRTVLVGRAHPLLCTFDAGWGLRDVQGDAAFYGIDSDDPERGVRELQDLFIGLAIDDDQDLPFIELSSGRSAHVHLIVDEDMFHVLLLDAESERERQRSQQQLGNEAVLASHETFRAIGRLKDIRSELERQRASLEEANALKNALIATLSHEFRTPLTSVFGYLHLLEQRREDGASSLQAMQAIRRNATYLYTLAENLLEYARDESANVLLNPAPVDLVSLAADLEAMFRPLAEDKGLRFHVELLRDDTQSPWLDEVRLRQVAINLLSNAVRYTAEGEISASFTWRDARLHLSIRDSGIGIAEEYQAKVFKPFNRGGQAGSKGAGLGLSIVRRLVAKMHGSLTLQSTPGEGSCFSVDLPTLTIPAGRGGANGPGVDGRSVLVVDDDPDIALLLEVLLTDLGFKVRIADNGATAVAVAMQETPDVLLIDVEMPGMTGNAAVYQLRARGYAGRIITVSATATEAAHDAAIRAGADAFLTKPLDVDQFVATIRSIQDVASEA